MALEPRPRGAKPGVKKAAPSRKVVDRSYKPKEEDDEEVQEVKLN